MNYFSIRLFKSRIFLKVFAIFAVLKCAAFADILEGQEPIFSSGYWEGYNFGEGEKEICMATTLARYDKAQDADKRFIVFLDFGLKVFTTLDEAEFFRNGDANLFVYPIQIGDNSLWSSKRFRFISTGAAGFASTDFDELLTYLLDSERSVIEQKSASVAIYSEGFNEVYEALKDRCAE
ncbi:MAG: hypothetical protein AAF557_16935 [Pseudomonadota bacterium]